MQMSSFNSFPSSGSLQRETADFLSAVYDPFKSDIPARVPDMCTDETLCMNDYDDVIVISNNTGQSMTGAMIFPLISQSFLSSLLSSYAGNVNVDNYYWRLAVLPIMSNSEVVGDLEYNLYNGINQTTILGALNQATGANDYALGEGLAESFRIFSFGIKVLPTIETITSSSTIAIANIWGGQMSADDLANIMTSFAMSHGKSKTLLDYYGIGERPIDEFKIDSKHSGPLAHAMKPAFLSNRRKFLRAQRLGENHSGYSVFELVRNAAHVQEFPNSEGCTVRYNPFQRPDQLNWVDVDSIYNEATVTSQGWQALGGLQMPFVCIRFTKGISTDEDLPFKLYTRYWLETKLYMPTPIYTTPSPCDPNYDEIVRMASEHKAPLAVKGHSFRSFYSMLQSFLRLLRPLGRPRRRQRARRPMRRYGRKRKTRQPKSVLPGLTKTNELVVKKTPNTVVAVSLPQRKRRLRRKNRKKVQVVIKK